VSTLSDYCKLIVDTEHKTAPTQPTGIPSIRTPNVGRGRLVLTDVKRVSEETFKAWTRRAVPETNDIIIAREAPVGNAALVMPGQRVCLGQRTVLVRPDEEKVLPAFLCYWLLGDYAQSFFRAVSTGAITPHLNMRDIRALPVGQLPSLPVQERIAAILSAYDDLIEVNTRRIAILEEMARRIYEEWFVRGRDGEASTKQIAEVATLHRGKSYRSKELSDPGVGVPMLNLKNIAAWGGYRRDGLKWFSGDFKATQSATAGDILMAVTDMTQERRLVGQCAMVPREIEGDAIFSMDLLKLEPTDAVNSDFLYATLRWSGCALELKEHANGANVLHLSPKAVAAHEVFIPPLKTQERFAEVAGPMLGLSEMLAVQNQNLRAQRDLLLPRLVSGKLDVSELDLPVAEAAVA
jgi:type I restriction enzyme S subunit